LVIRTRIELLTIAIELPIIIGLVITVELGIAVFRKCRKIISSMVEIRIRSVRSSFKTGRWNRK